ncbi:MAG TPA: NAD-dependent epimerase/dehydratase family protein [bacterium]|nr:NAD-dependent epimerase/dehydratase family protein [bacterium]HQL62504.1 NAD-dependent epimerase/dehydratase family protein [bacterium]
MDIDLSRFSGPVIKSEIDLENRLSGPTPDVVRAMSELEGNLMILGVGGKMGPTLARLAARTVKDAGLNKKIIGVDLFPSNVHREKIEQAGVETIACDCLDRAALESLPDVPNLVFMAGRKFGSTGAEHLTWAVNTYLPALVAQRFRNSRIVVFSSGNVYPFTSVLQGGPSEDHPTGPIGDYAQSCIGRERMFQYFSDRFGTKALIFRLNYAVELRYGIILDIAQKVHAGIPIDLTMGNVNIIWQGDANARVLQSFALCDTPPRILNVTGPEIISIRWMARRLGHLLGREPVFTGSESETALISNSAQSMTLFGYPTVPIGRVIEWVAYWALIGGPTLDKPTHFEVRDGKF